MRQISKIRYSQCSFIFIMIMIYGIMVTMNFFTPKCVDDYFYSLKLPECQKIYNIGDIFPTLQQHAQQVNGRLVSHFFAYFFNFLPKTVFNVINPAVFLLLMLLIYSYACNFEKYDSFIFLFSFCAVWYYEYAFGQVNVWLTGSCNYLWGIVVSLLFISPFYQLYIGNNMSNLLKKILFLVFSFFAGAYNEIASSAMIMMSVLFLAVVLLNKRKPTHVYYLSIIVACVGYITMVFAPAEALKVGSSGSFTGLLRYALKMYVGYLPLLVLWVLLFVYLCVEKTSQGMFKFFEPDSLLTSAVFMLGSLEANFVLAFASSYSDRCASPSLIYLVTAIGILLYDFSNLKKNSIVSLLFMVWILPFSLYNGVYGTYDIYRTGRDMKKNITVVSKALERGETTVSVPYVYASTKYSPIFDLKYLDTENEKDWPNYYIAWYFGLDSIIGER